MGRVKISIQKEVLEQLYLKEYKSPTAIAKLYNCHRMTVQARLKELNIQFRSQSMARMRYRKFDFSGDLIEKAYLIGFRLGDLNVYQTSSTSDLIVVRCNTTNTTQIDLINKLFSKYGTVTISIGKYSTNVNCYLNRSFLFLLSNEKKVPLWIAENDQTIAAFIAGYVDADGTFQLNQGKGRFAISAYDKDILYWIHTNLGKFDILSIYKKVANKGEKSVGKYYFKEDVWRININQAGSLFKFIILIKDYLLHEKRIKDMQSVMINIETRKQRGTI